MKQPKGKACEWVKVSKPNTEVSFKTSCGEKTNALDLIIAIKKKTCFYCGKLVKVREGR